jgi:hypothetical protein
MRVLLLVLVLHSPRAATVASAFLLSPDDAALPRQPQQQQQQRTQQQQPQSLQCNGLLIRPVKTTTTTSSSSSTMKEDKVNHPQHHPHPDIPRLAEQQRQEWTDKSIAYYSTIMRAERRRSMGQINEAEWDSAHYQETLLGLAQKHYFALRKIKSGHYRHAELIYRRIIQELLTHNKEDNDDEHHGGSGGEDCDHASLAVTTLLLALHLQRMGDWKETRSVFLHFFRVVVLQSKSNNSNNSNKNNTAKEECACSAKVLGAYALFEMKRGNRFKSLEIAKKAIEFDPTMEPVLQWKQFREVVQRQRVVSGQASSSAAAIKNKL